jgi:hypothetical protein
LECGIGGLRLETSIGKKVSKTLCQRTSQVWWCIPVIPAVWEVEVGKSQFEAALDNRENLSEK